MNLDYHPFTLASNPRMESTCVRCGRPRDHEIHSQGVTIPEPKNEMWRQGYDTAVNLVRVTAARLGEQGAGSLQSTLDGLVLTLERSRDEVEERALD